MMRYLIHQVPNPGTAGPLHDTQIAYMDSQNMLDYLFNILHIKTSMNHQAKLNIHQ